MSVRWLLRPDALVALENEEVKGSLSRYIEVVRDRKPALFILASRFAVDHEGQLGEAWKDHDMSMGEFWGFVDENEGRELPSRPKHSLLDLKARLAADMTLSCNLCERGCGANRFNGEKGACGLGSRPRVATHFIHMGEEPPISPSGTIFFASCNFRCVYCQNWDISQDKTAGKEFDAASLAKVFSDLRHRGARNINLVGGEPTPNLPSAIDALRLTEVSIPIVWNSNMYLSVESMKLLIGLVDLWLPDFKYWDESHALKFSGIPRYREVVARNLKMAYDARGELLIRHLVLPNHLECCTKPILGWIAENTPNALVNVMAQYRPEHKAMNFPEISRRPSKSEMSGAYEEARRLGLKWKSCS